MKAKERCIDNCTDAPDHTQTQVFMTSPGFSSWTTKV